jgi:hypothetical protein
VGRDRAGGTETGNCVTKDVHLRADYRMDVGGADAAAVASGAAAAAALLCSVCNAYSLLQRCIRCGQMAAAVASFASITEAASKSVLTVGSGDGSQQVAALRAGFLGLTCTFMDSEQEVRSVIACVRACACVCVM